MKVDFENSFELLSQEEWNQYLSEEKIDSIMIDKRVFAKFSDRIMMYPILMEEIDELNNKVGSVKVSYALCRHYYDKGIPDKKHYIIEAKGAEYISGNKITIEDCTYIEKNHRILEKNGKYRKINQEKISLSDRVSIFLFVVAIISILVTIGCFALLKDYFGKENSYIDNIISEIGLVFAIVSTKYVRSFIERITMRPRILKKLTICIFVLLAPFYINALFALLGISQTISNCISVVGIILSLLSYE